MSAKLLVLLCLLVVLGHLAAQAPPAPAFVSVSVQPSDGHAAPVVADVRGGGWRMENSPVRALLDAAYPTRDGEILNAPSWIGDARYDISATAAGDPSREELQAMLRRLLQERFAFRGHVEEQERWSEEADPHARDGSRRRVVVEVLVIKHIERPAAQ
ncbi:MAG: TIGR03435 family protein [Vicinamibacterales bacterium]